MEGKYKREVKTVKGVAEGGRKERRKRGLER